MPAHWTTTIPVSVPLREEELVCPPGDADAALRILTMLRDCLDVNTEVLDADGRKWLRNRIHFWTRRVESPSDWFRIRGDVPGGRAVLDLDFRTERCLLRVDEVLRHYEGRSGPTPREIAQRERERRERVQAAGRQTRRRRKERAEREERESRAEMDGLSADERERIMREILAGVGGQK